jgi:hypothetical protein
MMELYREAIARMRELPEDVQDATARQLLQYVDEITTLNEGPRYSKAQLPLPNSFKRSPWWRAR